MTGKILSGRARKDLTNIKPGVEYNMESTIEEIRAVDLLTYEEAVESGETLFMFSYPNLKARVVLALVPGLKDKFLILYSESGGDQVGSTWFHSEGLGKAYEIFRGDLTLKQ